MKLRTLKRGHFVYDRWFPGQGVGRVEEVLKTRAKIRFGKDLHTYDAAHCQFLERVR